MLREMEKVPSYSPLAIPRRAPIVYFPAFSYFLTQVILVPLLSQPLISYASKQPRFLSMGVVRSKGWESGVLIAARLGPQTEREQRFDSMKDQGSDERNLTKAETKSQSNSFICDNSKKLGGNFQQCTWHKRMD